MKKTTSISLLFSIVLVVTLIFASLPFDSSPTIRFAYADATTEDEYGNFIVGIEIVQWDPDEEFWIYNKRWHENVYEAGYINYTENEEISLKPYQETKIRVTVAINDTIATDANQALARTLVILTVTNAPSLDGIMGQWKAPEHDEVDQYHVYYETDWVTGPGETVVYTVSWEYKVLIAD